MRAMILAAGRGKRLQPLTDTIPKPLITVGGHSLIEHRLKALVRANFKEVVINVSYKAKDIIDALGDGKKYGIDIQYSFEPNECGLETGGGIFQALPLLGKDPFLVMNADVWTDYPLEKLPKQILGLAHSVLVDNTSDRKEGDFDLQDGFVLEEPKRLIFAGISVYRPELFNDCQPGFFSVVPLLRKAMAAKQMTGEHYQGDWFDVGTVERLQMLNEHLRVKRGVV